MKRIVIIGASSGMGRQIAADFAAAGWKVGVAARRLEPLQQLKSRFPDNIETACIDVTAPDAAGRFSRLVEQLDGMDLLLYASGIGFTDPELDDTRIADTLQVNVVGFARIISAAYRHFRDSDNPCGGQIAAITSVAGTKGIGVSAAYSASKRFQQMFLNALRQLANQQKVNVAITDVRPGFVRTALLDENREYPMIMSVEYASRLIERAIVRRKKVAYIDSRWGIVSELWAMLPECVWRHIRLEFN